MSEEQDLADAASEATNLPDPRDVMKEDEEVPIREIFNERFLKERTEFETFDEMVAESPSDATSADDLGLVRDGDWDAFVAETTDFESEQKFVFAARDHWVATRLNL